MTTLHKLALTIAIVVMVGAVPAMAQVPTAQETTVKSPSGTGAIDSKTDATMFRASTLIGHSLVNSNNENVGSVHDIVMDRQSGKVRYVVVTYGGFLGIGNKLFAVPYEALRYTSQPTTNVLGADRYKHQLVLDVTKEQMQGAVGFDEDNWPNFHDSQFQTELKKRYRVENPNRLSGDAPEKR